MRDRVLLLIYGVGEEDGTIRGDARGDPVTVPASCLPSIIPISAADRASFRSCPHDKNSLRPADRLDHIQKLSEVIVKSLRISPCGQV